MSHARSNLKARRNPPSAKHAGSTRPSGIVELLQLRRQLVDED
jgi:hypothetical protein